MQVNVTDNFLLPSITKKLIVFFSGYPGQDPLENFNLHSRQILCDAIINAKQFKLKFNPSYYAKRPQEYLRTRWTNWDSLDRITKNIQRFSRKKFLEYQPRNVRLGSTDYRQIKCLPCVITRKVEWFITFGFVDKFLYVLEKRNEKSPNSHGLRLTAILEPSAVINNQPLEYLYNQLQTSKGRYTTWKYSSPKPFSVKLILFSYL